MKTALLLAIILTVAFAVANASDDHPNKPIAEKRLNGVVRKFAELVVNKKNAEISFPYQSSEDDNTENHLFGALKHVFWEIGGGLWDLSKIVGGGIFNIGKIIGKEIIDDAEKGFDITKHEIDFAIKACEYAFNAVKHKIENIKLPYIDLPALVEPIIKVVEIIENLIPCAKTLQSALPKMIAFAKATAAEDTAGAVKNLLDFLHLMPDISQKCLKKPFTIPANAMNRIQCAADIVGLTADVVQFVVTPEDIIHDIYSLGHMIDFIPQTISDCTGAFN
eukprot:CAMPEP_0176411248 /NCGR_PEP_ID=MMETSP0127-20121128/3504_1 /TAXON_ID=938130 /ORGANISM="Platyophrya macrostoma, Strain WH" /LENGTH=277 /DNA_ID=CAMNT_0017790829 /DNA_START=13 /DNA_END=849 /DNA_ORIENTATION=+